jgi:hypothetical protein
MAFGPVFPFSQAPDATGRAFPNVYLHGSGTVRRFAGLGYAAALAGDTAWDLMFRVPNTLPTGTLKLKVTCIAAATFGVIRLNPKWAAVAAGADPFAATLSAEGVTPDAKAGQAGAGDTLEWGTGDSGQLLRVTWTLNAATAPAAGETIVMQLLGETASWTLAQTLTCVPWVEWD